MGYELRTKCRQDISQQSVPGAVKRNVMGEDDAHAAKGASPKYSVELGPKIGKSRRIFGGRPRFMPYKHFNLRGWLRFQPLPNQLAKRVRQGKSGTPWCLPVGVLMGLHTPEQEPSRPIEEELPIK